MARYDWLCVGLKLLGVYFGVSGLASVWNVVLVMYAASTQRAPADNVSTIGVIGLLQPLVYLVAAFFLVFRTDSCARGCGESGPWTPQAP